MLTCLATSLRISTHRSLLRIGTMRCDAGVMEAHTVNSPRLGGSLSSQAAIPELGNYPSALPFLASYPSQKARLVHDPSHQPLCFARLTQELSSWRIGTTTPSCSIHIPTRRNTTNAKISRVVRLADRTDPLRGPVRAGRLPRTDTGGCEQVGGLG